MANAVYQKLGTAVVFGSEVADDVDWSTENISTAAGRQSDQHDLGVLTTARPLRYLVEFWAQFQATPTVGNICRLYALSAETASAATAHAQNDDGLSDAAVSAENKLRNLTYIGSIVVDEAAANIEMVMPPTIIELPRRYVQLVLWNAAGSAITNDAAETKARLTPLYDEIQ